VNVVPAGFQSSSRYDDVWSRDTEICPYCAFELAYEDEKCPGCGRTLISWDFLYAKAGSSLHILWVLLAGLGQLYLISGAVDIMLGNGLPRLLLDGLLMVTFFGLALAVYYRQAWAHRSTIVIVLLLLFLRLLGVLGLTGQYVADAADPAATILFGPVLNVVIDAVDILQTAGLALALLWAVLFTGPEFERRKSRLRARVDRQLREATSFDITGRRHAQQGRWATAILHWQRAAAQAPGNRHYHRRLGEAYARLQFFERSEDSLQTALRLTPDNDERNELERLVGQVHRQHEASLSRSNHGK
jgi:tetratricopeptide (TPR) repeat protein